MPYTHRISIVFFLGLTIAFAFIAADMAEGSRKIPLPSGPYTYDANTVLLIDSNGNSKNKYAVCDTDIETGTGKFAKALCFNGESSFIIVPDFRVSMYQAFTIEFWIKPAKERNQVVLGDGTVPGQVRMTGTIDSSGKFSFRMYSGDCPTVTSTSILSSDKWTHIVVMAKKGSYMRLYVNGLLEDAVKINGWSPYGSLKIGEALLSGTSRFNGSLEQIRISNIERQPLPAAEILSYFNTSRDALVAAIEVELEKNRKYIGTGDIISAKNYSSAEGCEVDADGNLIMVSPGACATYKVYVPADGHYSVMLRTFSAKGDGENLVRVGVKPITSKILNFASTCGKYLPYYGDNRWYWHEITGQYSFWLSKGWSELRVVFQNKEKNKSDKLKINAVGLTAANHYGWMNDKHRTMSRISPEAKASTERLRALPFRCAQVEYPFYYTVDVKGEEARLRTLNSIKDSIDRELASNGFNWIALSVYGNGARSVKADERGVCYPTKIPYLTPIINDYEDCIGEIISYAHKKGIKVGFYMPFTNVMVNPPPETGVSLPQLELMIAKELIDKYHPDGLFYEGITSLSIWKDLKELDPGITLFYFMAHADPFKIEAENQGAWNCITMDNLDYPEEIFPPIACLYATDEKVMNHLEFRRLIHRTLMTPKLRGIYLYFVSPESYMEPFCAVIGDIYRAPCQKYCTVK
jgi:hypothetical protein